MTVALYDKACDKADMSRPALPSLLDDDAIPSPADIAAALRVYPELLEHPALKTLVADADAAGITDAELQAVVDSVPHWPDTSRRRSGARKLIAAKRAIAAAFGLTLGVERLESPMPLGVEDGLPEMVAMLNGPFLAKVAPHLPYSMHDDTILRAAGRK